MNNHIPEQLKRLAKEDAELLRLLVCRFGGQPFNEQSWEQAASRDVNRSGAEQKLSFVKLRRSGWIHAVKKSWGERLYYIPVPKLLLALPAFFKPESVSLNPSELHIRCEAGPGLALDLLHTLACAAEQGLPLTAKGTVHKRNLQRLQELITLKEEHVKPLDLQYAHQEIYSPAAAVILDLLLCMGLLTKTPSSLVVHEGRLLQWLSLTEQEMNRTLLRTVCERYAQGDPGMQLFRYLAGLPAFQEGKWFDISGLLQWMDAEGIASAGASQAEAAAWLYALAGFGWGDVAEHHGGKLGFRWSIDAGSLLYDSAAALGEEQEGLYVQPDFDILCPPGVPFIRRWELLVCTDLIHCDRVSVYRLTKSSAERAAENGMSTEEILSLLRVSAIGEVPAHVAAALEQWGREIGRTRFEEVTLLTCMSEAEGDAIAAHPHLSGEANRIGPTHFIVQASDTAKLRKLLEGMGLTPRKTVGGSRQQGELRYPLLHLSGRLSRTEAECMLQERFYEQQGIVYSGRNVHFFEPDGDIPEPSSLFPGLEQVPGRWLQDYRLYHSSTAQHIVEQAQCWKTKVLLRHEGRSAEFAPVSISPSPWRAAGILHDLENGRFERLELGAEDLSELKLLLPSFD